MSELQYLVDILLDHLSKEPITFEKLFKKIKKTTKMESAEKFKRGLKMALFYLVSYEMVMLVNGKYKKITLNEKLHEVQYKRCINNPFPYKVRNACKKRKANIFSIGEVPNKKPKINNLNDDKNHIETSALVSVPDIKQDDVAIAKETTSPVNGICADQKDDVAIAKETTSHVNGISADQKLDEKLYDTPSMEKLSEKLVEQGEKAAEEKPAEEEKPGEMVNAEPYEELTDEQYEEYYNQLNKELDNMDPNCRTTKFYFQYYL